MTRPRPARRATILTSERLEDRITPTISFGSFDSNYTGSWMGDGSESVAIGDFTGSGVNDVAIADYAQGISIVMNKGGGVYNDIGQISVGNSPTIIKVADMFDNNIEDLIVGCAYADMVYVVPGNGNGTFGAPISIAVNDQVTDLAVANLVPGGLPDIVVGTSSGMAIVLSNGSGGYDAPVYYSASNSGNSSYVAVGDFFGSGYQDVAVSGNGDAIEVYPNEGDGTFGAPTAVNDPSSYQGGSIVAGNFTGDGNTDLAVSYEGTAAVGVLLGNGNGTFQKPVWINSGLPSSGASFVLAADFDLDGNLDLAFSNYDGEVVIPGNGKGGFGTPIQIAGSGYAESFAFGDLNGDGYPELVKAGFGVAINTSADIANSFSVSAPASDQAGNPITVTVTAKNAAGSTFTAYTGTIDLSSTIAIAGLPSQYQFVAADDGVANFKVTPTEAADITIAATDTLTKSTGSTTVSITAGLADASTSTVRLASATDASGEADLVTVVLQDDYGNPVTGISASDFWFYFLNGTSTGSFGPVTETKPGTYSADFTGAVAGSASNVILIVSGVKLNAQPSLTVVPQSVDPGETSVTFGDPVITAGETDTVTIEPKDAAGNPISGLRSADFSFALSGESGGNFGAVSPAANPGTYTATFTGVEAGTASSLTLTIDGVAVDAQPTVQVDPGAMSLSSSSVHFQSSIDPSGTADVVTILIEDARGNLIPGVATNDFAFSLSGGTSTGSMGPITPGQIPGTYTANYTGIIAGTPEKLLLKIDGISLSSSPSVQVVPGLPSASKTTITLASATDYSGKTDVVSVSAKDAAGNAITDLPAGDFSFSLSGGTSSGSFAAVASGSKPGSYLAEFTGYTSGTPSAVHLSLEDTAINAQPTVAVKAGAIGRIASTALFENATVVSGTMSLLKIAVADAAGNPIVGLTTGSITLSFSGGQSTGKFGTLSPTATPGTYTIPFTGLRAGSASTYKVAISGVLLASEPVVQVLPGLASAIESTATFAQSRVVSGNVDAISIVVKDASGNAVTGLSSGDFILSLGGGTSDGSIGTVSSSSTPGLYVASFTANAAGSLASLSVEVDGIVLHKKPTVTVLT